MNLLSVQDQRQFEAHLQQALVEVLGDDGDTPISAVIRRFVLQGGKRIRPQVCLWTYRTAAPTPTEPRSNRQAMRVACAWEIFHAFVLCHDDIIDNADRRRDQPSLHRQLAALDGDSLTFGRNLGIIAGDLLFGASMQLLHALELPWDVHLGLLRLFSEVVTRTGVGQAMDVWQTHQPACGDDEQRLLREYYLKTAAYTFEGPILSGALVAGLRGAALDALRGFSRDVGLAYQIHNDLLDLLVPAHPGCDLAQGKRTPALLGARQLLSAEHRLALDDLLDVIARGRPVSLSAVESLRQAVVSTPAIEHTRGLIAQSLAAAAQSACDQRLPEALRQGLRAWLERLEQSYFHPRATAV